MKLPKTSKNDGFLHDFLGARSAPQKLGSWVFKKKTLRGGCADGFVFHKCALKTTSGN